MDCTDTIFNLVEQRDNCRDEVKRLELACWMLAEWVNDAISDGGGYCPFADTLPCPKLENIYGDCDDFCKKCIYNHAKEVGRILPSATSDLEEK